MFAATSITNALEELRKGYESREGVEISVSYGGSQTLAQQIAQGAPADLFISAGEFPLRFLVERGRTDGPGTVLLSNDLVAVTRTDGLRLESMDQLDTDLVKRIAIAEPELAPAGAYAKESLTNLGLWQNVQDKLVFGADVRITLAYVEAGNVDVALVYRTDARVSSDLKLQEIVPAETYSTIVYPAVVVKDSDEKVQAGAFLTFLQTEAARAVFTRFGFLPPPFLPPP